MEPSNIVSKLHDYVDNTTSAEDLVRFLQLCHTEDLKNFVHAQIEKADSDEKRSMYYTMLPTNQVLNRDVLQHILSFANYDEDIMNRTVCSSWNELCKLNEERMLREVYQSVAELYPEPLPPASNTWVWHAARRRLHPLEQGFGYKGPLRNREDLISNCRNGDRILVHEGGYPMICEFGKVMGNLHFIGVSPNCGSEIVIENVESLDTLKLSNLFIHNWSMGKIHVCGKLELAGCHIQCRGVNVMRKGDLTMDHCLLEQSKSVGIGSMICIKRGAAKAHLRHNEIMGADRGITIETGAEKEDPIDLEITDNVFSEISEYAVAVGVQNECVLNVSRFAALDRCILDRNTSSVSTLKPNKLLVVDDSAIYKL